MKIWTPSVKTLACCLVLLSAGGCAGNGKTASKSPIALSGPTWVLESYGPRDTPMLIPEEIEITFRLDDKRVITGSSGCNTYTGSCIVKGHSIRIGPLSGTKRACPDQPKAMKLEQVFLSALSDVNRYVIEGEMLELHGHDGRDLIFRQRSS